MNSKLAVGILVLWLCGIACKKTVQPNELPHEKQWVVTTIAGNGSPFFADGAVLLSEFRNPADVAVTSDGSIYVADVLNHRIRKIAGGQVTTFAGSGVQDTTSGVGTAAGYAHPIQIAADGLGNLFTLDLHDLRVRKITAGAQVTVVAGTGVNGMINGRADTARFGVCSGIVIDGQGTIYICDYDNNQIRKISTDGFVSTVAGNGKKGYVNGRADTAEFYSLEGIVIDSQGNLFVADLNRIRKITPDGYVSTFAGTESMGFQDGAPDRASFKLIGDLVLDGQDNIYVTDDQRIRKITPQGQVSTIAGSVAGYRDGNASFAQFNNPYGLGIDREGAIYVADDNNNRIRKITFQ